MNKQQDQIARYINLAKDHEYSLVFINGEAANTVAKSGYLETTESNEIRKNFAEIVKKKNSRIVKSSATLSKINKDMELYSLMQCEPDW